jgi:pyruvate/2-oxoglutarate dehydrogenase complex dihydrolipoamide acyltransferase (E2) component
VSEGKSVKENEDLVELTTDKAAFNVHSPCAGIVGKIFKRVGDSVRVDENLLEINES